MSHAKRLECEIEIDFMWAQMRAVYDAGPHLTRDRAQVLGALRRRLEGLYQERERLLAPSRQEGT